MSAADAPIDAGPAASVAHLGDFPIVEFRRYVIRDGERRNFAERFESFFPEAFEQIGALALGQFFEAADPSRFTWLRGFSSFEARASVNGAFYDGALWKEHRAVMNAMMTDSDDVRLLRSLPGRGVPVLPAVDPVLEPSGARGVVAAQIFPLPPGGLDAFPLRAEDAFARYREAGARPAGLLATLDRENNFPRHPIRADGPFLVWLGVVEDERRERFLRPLAERFAREVRNELAGEAEWIALRPTPRSRLRWLPAGGGEAR